MITLRELVSAYDKHSLPKNADGFPKDLDWRLPLSKEVMLCRSSSDSLVPPCDSLYVQTLLTVRMVAGACTPS